MPAVVNPTSLVAKFTPFLDAGANMLAILGTKQCVHKLLLSAQDSEVATPFL
jgi:hypothetical protein